METKSYIKPYASPEDEIGGWTAFFDHLIDGYKEWRDHSKDDFFNDPELRTMDRERLGDMFDFVQQRSSISEYAGASYKLKCMLQLTEFELFTMMFCAINQLKSNYEFVASEVSGLQGRPMTLSVCYQLFSYFDHTFGNEIKNITDPERDVSYLFFSRTESVQADVPIYAREITLNPALLLFLKGEYALSDLLAPYTRMADLEYDEDDAAIHLQQKMQLDSLFSLKDTKFAIHLKGPNGVGKHHLLEKMAFKHNFPLIYIDFQALWMEKNQRVHAALKQLALEAMLLEARVCMENVFIPEDQIKDFREQNRLHLILKQMEDLLGNFFLLGSGDIIPDHKNPFAIYLLELSAPSMEERRELWEFFLSDYAVSEEMDPMRLAAKFNYCAADVRKVSQLAHLHCRAAGEERITNEHIMSAVRSLNINLLGGKAQYIRPVFSFDDMVLEDTQMQVLRDFCNRVLHRYTLMVEMGYDKKFPYGQSSALLLYGPPGTGKTMAAQAVAKELGMDLYKINLSQIFSKYIGETEKQLEEIFEMAKQGNAVLFFDEADALFSKRTEVSDSHDKYANVETSYLLQKMEEFDGILILATNNAGNMDPAFRRRMTASVGVQLPDEAQRLEMWRKSFTPETPLSANIDWNGLAQRFELPSSCIKQAALTASYLAAIEGRSVDRTHIIQAVRQEFTKLGKIFFQ